MKYVLLQAAMAVPFVTLFIIVASFISALILSSLYNLIIYYLVKNDSKKVRIFLVSTVFTITIFIIWIIWLLSLDSLE
jgi:hypothetical protein